MENIFKDAIIIGNGPSAITLSYMLAGNWPYYNGLKHPIDFLQHRLEESKEKSLLEQDLRYLSEGLEGRSLNPVSVLFDTLNHPQADLGIENPSVITWEKRKEHAVDHIVLGKGVPGGSWQKMDGSTLTISLGSWMELPNLNIREWDTTQNRLRFGQSGIRQKRATVGTVAEYYSYYVTSQGLSKYFVNNAVVTCVEPFDRVLCNSDLKNLWKVSGYVEILRNEILVRKPYSCVSPHVVLATGNSDQPNMLNVEGEELPFVLYSLSELEYVIEKGRLSESGSLLIVGAGLSAADAVIAARFHGIPIMHVFRRSVSDPELIFNKLPQNIYPEYHKVHQMMKDSKNDHYEGYRAFPSTKIHSIKQDGTVFITSSENNDILSSVKVLYVLVLIGMHPNLNFLPFKDLNLGINPGKPLNCKNNPMDIDLYSHESVFYPGMYGVGPLVGDNFVRFVQGGCLAVASHVTKSLHSRKL